MSQQIINIGPQPNDGQGDDLRLAFEKVNNNFSQIWDTGPVGTNIVISGSTISTTDVNENLYLSPNGIGNIVLNNNTQPRANNLYYLGQPDKRFRGAFLGTGGLTTTGNISGDYFIGDGSMLANLPAGNYSNANVAAFLPTNTSNVAGHYFIGDGSLLTNLPAGNYGNANVAAYLAIGNNTSNIVTLGNVSGTYILGDGSQLTNLPYLNYSNANVQAYLPTYAGTIGGNVNFAQAATSIISGRTVNQYVRLAAGNVRLADDFGPIRLQAQGNTWIFGTDGNITLPANTSSINYANGQPYGPGGTGSYGNANVAAFLPTYSGNIGNVNVTGQLTARTMANADHSSNVATTQYVQNVVAAAGGYGDAQVEALLESGNVNTNIITTANIAGSYILGNGYYLTGIQAGTNYSNANVATYLASGNVTSNIITTANVSASNFVGGNIYIGNTLLTRTLTVGTRITPVTVPLATNNSFNVHTRAGGNVTVYTT